MLIKDLQAKIASQNAAIVALQKENYALKARIASLEQDFYLLIHKPEANKS